MKRVLEGSDPSKTRACQQVSTPPCRRLVSHIVHARKLKCLQRGSAPLQTQTTLLGLLALPLSLARTLKAVISIMIPNAKA